LNVGGRVGVSRNVHVGGRVGVHRHVGVDSVGINTHHVVGHQHLIGGHGVVDVHGVVGSLGLATGRKRQGRSCDHDKSTHSKLPNYLRSGSGSPRHKSRAQ